MRTPQKLHFPGLRYLERSATRHETTQTNTCDPRCQLPAAKRRSCGRRADFWWVVASNLNRLNLLKDCVRQSDVSHLYNDPNPIIRYSRDKYGLRGTHDRPGSIDILTVGGSTTDQRYIRDGETWQDVLQDRFARTGVTVVVGNAGVDGQSTYGHIKNFKWWFPHIPDLKPGYILFYVGLNDFYMEDGYSHDQIVSEEQNLTQKLKDNSAVWHMIRTLRGAYKAMIVDKTRHVAVDFSKVHWTRDSIQKDYSVMDRRLSEYETRLRALADMTHRIGAKPIFVSQPSRKYRITPEGLMGDSSVSFYDGHKYNGVDYYHMMRKIDGVTKAIAMEKACVFVDLAIHTGWVDTDFYDFAHMTPKGAEKTGELLWGALKNVVTGAERGAED
jgi:hypothetical protein